jgi:hypothetical protein
MILYEVCVFLIDLLFGNGKFNIQRIFKIYNGKMSIFENLILKFKMRLYINLQLEAWLLRSWGFLWTWSVYDICHISSIWYDIICHMTYYINDICQYGCLKKPQVISNPASECKLIYKILINYKMHFFKKWHFLSIIFENPLYIGFRTSK